MNNRPCVIITFKDTQVAYLLGSEYFLRWLLAAFLVYRLSWTMSLR